MRTDESVSRRSFRFSPEWKRTEEGAELTPEIDSRLAGGEMRNGRYVVHSLSGNERNKLFMNSAGKSFSDMSGISGLDYIGDGRGFALLDYNRDGKQDIALVNANAPLFKLYRNNIHNQGNIVALRFEGSNHLGLAARQQTNRDGYGAVVIAEIDGGLTLKREHRCGEGFAAQNSATMLIGIGEAGKVSRLTVRWPSGQSYTQENVDAGSLVIARENSSQPFEMGAYFKEIASPTTVAQDDRHPTFPVEVSGSIEKGRLYTTTATWCEACLRHLPKVNALTEQLSADGIELVGLPIDPEDDRAKLEDYVAKWKPRYRMADDLSVADRSAVTQFLSTQTGAEEPPLPSSILIDAQGKALLVAPGIPTVSEIRKLLR